MEIGFIGLGRMGRNMAERLHEHAHSVYTFDVSGDARDAAHEKGIAVRDSIEKVIAELSAPRLVWIMVQRKDVEGVLETVLPLVSKGDIIVDGGNSYFEDSIRRSSLCAERGIAFIDVGVSGGVSAARNGACLMVGGPADAVTHIRPVLGTLGAPEGFAHVGNSGAGHFVKMVHNGIEYGMMQALGEGLEAIDGKRSDLSLDIAEALRIYTKGSIIEGKLASWLHQGWSEDPGLAKIEGSVPPGDTEEEMQSLAKLARMPALDVALSERERSRSDPSIAGKAVAIMRNLFGGHSVTKKEHA